MDDVGAVESSGGYRGDVLIPEVAYRFFSVAQKILVGDIPHAPGNDVDRIPFSQTGSAPGNDQGFVWSGGDQGTE